MISPRTYEVRTYGCQMNVHDSERLSGLLEDAGYVRADARRDGRRRRVQHLRRPRERRQPALRQPRPPGAGQGGAARHADRRRRLPRAEGPRRDHPPRARGSTSSSARTTSARCRSCSSAPGINDEAQVEILESLEVFPSTLPTRRESAYAAWVSHLGRLQQHLHVLHRPERCAAPRRTAARATSSPRSRRWSPRASSRSRCSGRTSTPTASSSATGIAFGKLLRACGEVDGLERVRFTSPHPKDFTDDVIAAMAETPNVMPQLHMPLQSGSDAVLKRDAPLVPAGPLPRHHRTGPRGDAGRRDHHRHHRRLPRRDRRRLRADARRRARGAVRGRVHVPVLQAARHPGRRHGRSGAEGRRAGALRAARRARRTTIAWAENKRLVGRAVEVLVAEGEGRKDDATHRLSGRAPDNRLVHFRPGARDRRGPATWSPSRSRMPRRITWSPTARR